MIGITSSATVMDDNFFIPASTFIGAKQGYVFKSDFKGLGYYLDVNNGNGGTNNVVLDKKRRFDGDNGISSNSKRLKVDEILRDKDFIQMSEKSLRLSFTKLTKWIDRNEREYVKFNTTKGNIRMQQINGKVSKQIDESNMKIMDVLNHISPVTAYPQLFHIVGEQGNISALLKLLLHVNLNISFLVVELLHGMIDPEEMMESSHTFNIFIQEYIKQSGLELLARNVIRISSSLNELVVQPNDDITVLEKYNECIEQTLLTFENILEIIPTKTNDLLAKFPEFLHWILNILYNSNTNNAGNKNHNNNNTSYLACEILSIFLLSNVVNRKAMSLDLSNNTNNNYYIVNAASKSAVDNTNNNRITGVHLLLSILKTYENKKENPKTMEEEEFLLTLFSSVVCVLTETTNQDIFADINGFEIMLRMIRQRNITYRRAFEVIDAAVTNHPANCKRFVDAGGLKVLFPAYMAKGKINVGKHKIKMKSAIRSQDEECILSIVSCLFFNLKDMEYERLLSKFLKHDFEKVHRCIELHGTYYFKCYGNDDDGNNNNHNVTNDDDLLNDRLEKGLFTLQKIDFILAMLYNENRDGLRNCIVAQFKEQGFEFEEVSKTLIDYSKILNSSGNKKAGVTSNNNDIARIQNANATTLFDKINAINETWKSISLSLKKQEI
jgi:hypothetical protein